MNFKFNGELWHPILAMVLVNGAVGTMSALIKKTLDGGVDHMVVGTYRLAISTICLAPIAYFYERKIRPKLNAKILCQLFLSGLLGASFNQYFVLLGLAYTSTTLSCAFLSLTPAVTFVMVLIFRIEKLNMKSVAGKAKVMGTLICVGGVLFLSFYEGVPLTNHRPRENLGHISHKHSSKEKMAIGSILVFIGTVLWSSWSLLQVEINKSYPCKYSSTVIMCFFGTFQSFLLSLIKQRNITMWVMKDKFDVFCLLYAGIVGQGLCTVGQIWCIKKRGPVFASAFIPITVIFATIVGAFLLHQPLYLGSVLGAIIVLIGLYIFLWGKRKDTSGEECGIIKQTQIGVGDEESINSTSKTILPLSIHSTTSAK